MAAAAHPWILAPWSCCCFPASATCSSPVLSLCFPLAQGSFNYPEYKSAFKAHQEIHQHQCAGMCLQWKYTLFQFGDTPSEDPSTKFSCCHHCIYPKALPGNAAHGISSLSHINMEYSFKSAFFFQFLPPSTSRGKRELNLTSALHFVFIPYTKLCPQASLMPIWGFSQTLKKLPLGDSELEILIKAIYKPGQ